MSEYRVMHIDGAYQIQKKRYKHWEVVGETKNIESAKQMVRDLRGGILDD